MSSPNQGGGPEPRCPAGGLLEGSGLAPPPMGLKLPCPSPQETGADGPCHPFLMVQNLSHKWGP